MKKKYFFTFILMNIIALFFLNSCSNEDLVTEGKTDLININQARKQFNNNPIKLKNNIYFSNELDWERGRLEKDTLSIPILSNKPILIKRLKNPNSSKYLYPFLLVTKNKLNNTLDYNLKVFIASNSKDYDRDSYHLYNINNKLIQNKEKPAYKNISKTSKISDFDCELWGYFLTNNDTGERKLIYTWYVCSGSGSGQSEQAPPGDGGGGGDGTSNDQAAEENIDDSQLDTCLQEILALLKNASNTNISNVMKKMGLNNTNYVTMKMGTMEKPGNYAETRKISNYHYSVTFTQDNYTSATKLYKATALVHEIIHAYILSIVDDYNTYPTNAPFTDFPELFKIYVNKTSPIGNASYAQHEDMANKYVDAIASALEEYQWNDTGIPSSLADKQVFLDMAWSGLQNTEVFNNKFPPGSVDNTRITNRITAETNGVYYQGQWAVGKPCN